MNETLKPCPYCGGEAEILTSTSTINRWASCTECASEGPEGDTAEAAVALWNTRTESPEKTCRDCRWWDSESLWCSDSVPLGKLPHDSGVVSDCGPDFGCLHWSGRDEG